MAQEKCVCGEEATASFTYATGPDTYDTVPLCEAHVGVPGDVILRAVQEDTPRARQRALDEGMETVRAAFGNHFKMGRT